MGVFQQKQASIKLKGAPVYANKNVYPSPKNHILTCNLPGDPQLLITCLYTLSIRRFWSRNHKINTDIATG